MPARRWTRQTSEAASALAVLVVAAGCGGTQTPAAAPSRSTVVSPATGTTVVSPTPSSPTATTEPVRRRIIDAYDAMWADMVKAARTADYRSPALAAHTVDPATGQLRRTLLNFKKLGWVAKGNAVPHPTVVSMQPSTNPVHARIVDCLDETHWLTYDAKTGEHTDDKPGQRYRVNALMRHIASGWKVESFTIASGGSC